VIDDQAPGTGAHEDQPEARRRDGTGERGHAERCADQKHRDRNPSRAGGRVEATEDRVADTACLRRRGGIAGAGAGARLTGKLTGEPGVSDLLGQLGQCFAFPVGQLDVVVAHGDLLEDSLRSCSGSYPDEAPSTLKPSAMRAGGCSQAATGSALSSEIRASEDANVGQ
jgi:hypothetical protein